MITARIFETLRTIDVLEEPHDQLSKHPVQYSVYNKGRAQLGYIFVKSDGETFRWVFRPAAFCNFDAKLMLEIQWVLDKLDRDYLSSTPNTKT